MKHAKKQEHVTKSQENHSQQKQIHRQTLAVGLTDKKFKPTVINMLNKLQEEINIMAEYMGYFKIKRKKLELIKEPNRNLRAEKS